MSGAFEEVNDMLSLDRYNMEAFMLKAKFCIEINDYSKANEVKLEKFPSLDNYKLSVKALMDINALIETMNFYHRVLEIKRDMEVKRDLGRAIIKTHDYIEALVYYKENCKVDDKVINNQIVINYWEMCIDFINLEYLLFRNNSFTTLQELKDLIVLNLQKIKGHLKRFDDFKLRDIYAKVKFKYALILKGNVFLKCKRC